MLITVVPQILSITLIFWFLLVVAGPFSLCLSMMSSLMPEEENQAEIFLLITYSLMSPIRMNLSTSYLYLLICACNSSRKALMGHDLLPMSE